MPHHPPRTAVLLAAGEGTRFKSQLVKVLHPLCGKPMLLHLLDKLRQIEVERIIVVVGRDAQAVREAVSGPGVRFAVQEEQLGTGHAVQAAAPMIEDGESSVLVLYGDAPLIRPETLRRLLRAVEEGGADQALLTAEPDDPAGYGRVLRDEKGRPRDTVEEEDAEAEQKRIREVNAGFYCFRGSALLSGLAELDNDNRQGEYYLTDLLGIHRSQGRPVSAVRSEDPGEALGINDRLQLAQAEALMRREIAERWMLEGVTMLDPSSVLIDAQVRIGRDSVLYPGVILEGRTAIGEGCSLRAHCHLLDAEIGDGALIDHCSVVRDSSVGAETTVGPFAHLRGKARIGRRVRIGNFVEVKKSTVEDEAKASHLAYLGDARVGARSNIGAGTITCNYDGRKKNPTIIEDDVFIGSNSQLVAPVRIGRGAYVAAGSTITEDVPAGSLAIARSRQTVKPDWGEE